MNIASIVSTYPPYKGGMGNAARDTAAVLQKQGHDVTVFTLAPDGREGQENGVTRLASKLSLGFKNGGFVPQLYRELAKGPVIASGTECSEVQHGNPGIASSKTPRNDTTFDLIYLHYPFYGGAEIVWLYKLLHPKMRLVIQFHMDTPKLSRLGKLLMLPSIFIRKSLFKRAEKIICSTLDYAEHSSIGGYVKQWPEKFVEIPFGVDLRRFHVFPYDVPVLQEMRERYGIAEGDKVVMFLGGLDRAHSFKGVDVLLKAMARPHPNPPLSKGRELKRRLVLSGKVKVMICGDGDLKSEYEQQAKKLGIEKNVIFTGRVADDEMTLHYNLADVFVLPSTDTSEAFGIVLLEAMACGIPVIASDLPGVRAVFENGVSGYTVVPGSPKHLAAKLHDYLRHPQRRWKMGRAARERVEELYDVEMVEEKVREVFG